MNIDTIGTVIVQPLQQQHLPLTNFCSIYISNNLDTGYDLLRSSLLLPQPELETIIITTYIYYDIDAEFSIKIPLGILICRISFGSSLRAIRSAPPYYLKSCNYCLHGKPIGCWRSWHINGNMLEIGYYDNGQQTGCWQFYGMGTLFNLNQKGYYKNGKRTGLWQLKYPDSYCKGYYKDGLQVGQWQYFDKDGQLRHIRNYA